MSADDQEIVLEVDGVSKRFGGTLALDRVELTVRAGQIHAFLGANGAGKSTLIRILADVHAADGGRFLWRGVETSGAEISKRIAIVHQDLGLVDFMSVGENMAMGYGYPRRRNGLIDWPAVDARARSVLDELGAPLPLHTAVSNLSPAERSIVAIARAVSRDVELLILDEPTASLPEADVGRLFAALGRLRERNVAIIYVTHRLDEVFRIADAATVIRDGRTIARHASLEGLTSDQLVSEIVGRLLQHASKRETIERAPVLTVEGLKSYAIGPVGFSLGKGEILGLAGLRAQGHEGVGRMLAGVYRPTAGSIALDGRKHRFGGTIDAIRAGIGFATGRRAEEAVAPAMTVRENLFLNPLNFGARRHTLRNLRREARDAAAVLARFAVKPADPNRDIGTLSGGNQQKVVLARWTGQAYRVIVLEDPTIGVDIGAKAEIYRMMLADCEAGTSYIVVSSDIEELVNVCDRVLAFSRGVVVAELAGDDLTTEALTHAVSGALDATPVLEGGVVSGPDEIKTEGPQPPLSVPPSRPEPGNERSTRGIALYVLSTHGLLIFGILLAIIFAVLLPGTFAGIQTVRAILGNNTTVALLAMAEMLVIAGGNYDLSIAYSIGLMHIIALSLIIWVGLPWPLVVVLTVLAGGVVGWINGALVEYAKIDSFIATLGVGTVLYGVGTFITNGTQVVGVVPEWFADLNDARLFGLPFPTYLVVLVAIIAWICLEHLPLGRHLYAIGSNRRAAELTGVNSRRLIMGSFVWSGLLVGLAGVILAARLQVAQSSVGPEFLLPAFVGALLGATTVRPGRVNAAGTIIAVLVLAVGIAGLQQLGNSFFVEPIFQGGALIVSVGLAGYAARRRKT